MKKKTMSIVLAVLTAAWLAMPVSANSSWVWISESRPNDLLPFVIVGTLFIEISAIRFAAGVRSTGKIVAVTVLANLVSFAVPYLLMYIDVAAENSTVHDSNPFTLKDRMEKLPFYTVGLSFLIMTVVFELPIVYNALKKQTDNRKRLAIVIVAANVVTTVLTAVVERTFCYGSW